MADILTSKIQVPSLPDDTLILKDAEARNDLSTALATATGNPLNFSTRSAQKANETVISLAPIQDLHGYDYPWPAGGGKNQLNATEAQANCTLSNGVYTLNSIPQTNQGFTIGYVTLAVGNYIINGGFSNDFRCFITVDGVSYTSKGNDESFTISTTGEYAVKGVINTTAIANTQIKPMIRLATETDPTFAPYENKCPIDGRTETSLMGCGKNLVNVDDLDLIQYNSSGGQYLGVVFEEPGTYTVSATKVSNDKYIMARKVENGVYNDISYIIQPNQVAQTYTATITKNDKLLLFINYSSLSSLDLAKEAMALNKVQAEFSPSATAYEPFVESNNLTIQFGEKVYGATFTMETGELVVNRAYIRKTEFDYKSSSVFNNIYRMGTINKSDIKNISNTISDKFKYKYVYYENEFAFFIVEKTESDEIYVGLTLDSSVDTLAKANTWLTNNGGYIDFCYELATPRTITLTPNEISLLSGVNVISTDADGITLTYRGGKVATLGDLEDAANNLQEQIDQNETIKDETTQLLYKLGVNNGLLFMEEV